MSSLVYLTVCKAKNKFFELLKKPVRLIMYIGFILLLLMNFTVSENSPVGERPLVEFKAIIFCFYLVCFISETKKGLHSGGTMFTMADVNLLFMSSVRPISILFHGMLSRLGSSVFMGVAFIYQFALLRSYYPIKIADMLVAITGYGAVVFVSQLTGMLVYFYTCGEQNKVKTAKTVLYTVCALFIIPVVFRLVSSGVFTLTRIAEAVIGASIRLFPVAGWIFTAFDGLMSGDKIKIFSGTAFCLIFVICAFLVLAFSKHGYYEDVLLSCERNSDKKAQEGTASSVKIRTDGSELKKGRGAAVFFYKHMLENRRTKSAVFSPTTVFYLVVIGVYGFVFDADFVMLFSLSCMVSFLPALSGRWFKELSMPYVYMIPEPPLKKLFYILPEMLPKIITESVFQCALIGYLCHFGIVTTLLVILARISVSFVLTATSLLMARIFREKEKNSLFVTLSVFPGMLFLLPSVLLCMLMVNFGMGLTVAFISMTAVNISVSVLLLFFARNLLKNT